MTYRSSEEKLKDIAGIRKGVDDMILSAWERGYKLGLLDGEKRARETMISKIDNSQCSIFTILDESFEKDRTFKDNTGLKITVKAYPHGYSIFYADCSIEEFENNDSTENNFRKAMEQLIEFGLIDKKKAEKLSTSIKIEEAEL